MSSSSDSGTDKLISYPRIPREDLEVQDQLGCGSFGSVYRGIWRNAGKELVVALKKVFMLEKEVDILSQIRHRNIIQFFGVSPANPDFYIVTEFVENGSLYEYLHNDSAELAFDLILKWALEIAYGVAYLHNEAPVTIIHRDLKSKNVVLSKDYVCKLCDFGTSKDLTHSFTMPTWAGTAAWMSPEIISQKEGITTTTDVWSYAVVLWELVSREVPYKGLTEFKIFSIITQFGERLVIPETCPEELRNLLKNCWHTNPKDRIDMKTVILQLQNMQNNSEVREECTKFFNKKGDWKNEIETQLTELNALKINLARQKEELELREKALRKRENTHKSYMYLHELACINDISIWTVDDTASWINLVSETSPVPVSQETIDKLIFYINQYEIDGARLLNVGPADLHKLGIDKGPFCDHLLLEIEVLRSKYSHDYLEYPTLRMSSIIERRNRTDKSKQAFDFPVVLHVGMYQREACSTTCSSRYRFKIFVDSDWQACTMIDSMPAEIYDSATVIKDVCISLVDGNKKVLLETVRCLCPPFGYLEWVNAPQNGSPVHVTCVITYTDQVLKPRNTCIKAEISDFSFPQAVHDRVVMLKIRPIATNTSISRVSSALFNNSIQSSTNSSSPMKGVWRKRCSSFGQESAPEKPHIGKSWSTVASANRNHEIQHSVSLNVKSPDEFPALGGSFQNHTMAVTHSANHLKNNLIKIRRNRRSSENENVDSKQKASFFLDSASPPLVDGNPFLRNIAEVKEAGKDKAAENGHCCKNNCRHRNQIVPAREISNIDEAASIKTDKKRKNKPPRKGAQPFTKSDGSNGVVEAKEEENRFSRSSQNIYGGYNKWKWR